jgi:hypothetical protein
LGDLNSTAYGADDEAGNPATTTCGGTFVTVDAEKGIYSSKFGSSNGTERYLNYVYANSDNDPDQKDSHHILYVYLTQENGLNNICSTNTLANPGYYSVDKCQPLDSNHGDPKHHVAYCENGFEINKTQEMFRCCGSGLPGSNASCPQYKPYNNP